MAETSFTDLHKASYQYQGQKDTINQRTNDGRAYKEPQGHNQYHANQTGHSRDVPPNMDYHSNHTRDVAPQNSNLNTNHHTGQSRSVPPQGADVTKSANYRPSNTREQGRSDNYHATHSRDVPPNAARSANHPSHQARDIPNHASNRNVNYQNSRDIPPNQVDPNRQASYHNQPNKSMLNQAYDANKGTHHSKDIPPFGNDASKAGNNYNHHTGDAQQQGNQPDKSGSNKQSGTVKRQAPTLPPNQNYNTDGGHSTHAQHPSASYSQKSKTHQDLRPGAQKQTQGSGQYGYENKGYAPNEAVPRVDNRKYENDGPRERPMSENRSGCDKQDPRKRYPPTSQNDMSQKTGYHGTHQNNSLSSSRHDLTHSKNDLSQSRPDVSSYNGSHPKKPLHSSRHDLAHSRNDLSRSVHDLHQSKDGWNKDYQPSSRTDTKQGQGYHATHQNKSLSSSRHDLAHSRNDLSRLAHDLHQGPRKDYPPTEGSQRPSYHGSHQDKSLSSSRHDLAHSRNDLSQSRQDLYPGKEATKNEHPPRNDMSQGQSYHGSHQDKPLSSSRHDLAQSVQNVPQQHTQSTSGQTGNKGYDTTRSHSSQVPSKDIRADSSGKDTRKYERHSNNKQFQHGPNAPSTKRRDRIMSNQEGGTAMHAVPRSQRHSRASQNGGFDSAPPVRTTSLSALNQIGQPNVSNNPAGNASQSNLYRTSSVPTISQQVSQLSQSTPDLTTSPNGNLYRSKSILSLALEAQQQNGGTNLRRTASLHSLIASNPNLARTASTYALYEMQIEKGVIPKDHKQTYVLSFIAAFILFPISLSWGLVLVHFTRKNKSMWKEDLARAIQTNNRLFWCSIIAIVLSATLWITLFFMIIFHTLPGT